MTDGDCRGSERPSHGTSEHTNVAVRGRTGGNRVNARGWTLPPTRGSRSGCSPHPGGLRKPGTAGIRVRARTVELREHRASAGRRYLPSRRRPHQRATVEHLAPPRAVDPDSRMTPSHMLYSSVSRLPSVLTGDLTHAPRMQGYTLSPGIRLRASEMDRRDLWECQPRIRPVNPPSRLATVRETCIAGPRVVA